MTSNPEKLSCISIIICDEVYRDERTKKQVIIGTFNRITTPSVPCGHARMVVLFSVTNGNGNYHLTLRVEHEQTGHTVAEINGPFKIDDPLAISDISVELRNLVFPNEGKYWVELKADGEILQTRPFIVQKKKMAAAEEGDDGS